VLGPVKKSGTACLDDSRRVLASRAVSRTLYFAYGSNMDGATFRQRRGIEWTRAAPALARGWRLAVDKPSLLGTGEAMATIERDAGGEVWGVLYEIATADYEHLEFTEGVLIDHYRRSEIDVAPRHTWDAPIVTALTLISAVHDHTIRPTTRYMNLLLAGAAEHGLPESWIETLRRIEAVEEKAEHAALRPYFDRAMRRSD
jgi:gamma-glutamylcyclotransferase